MHFKATLKCLLTVAAILLRTLATEATSCDWSGGCSLPMTSALKTSRKAEKRAQSAEDVRVALT